MKSELISALAIFGAVVIVAALVNRLMPAHRPRVRRCVILYGIYILTLAASLTLDAFGLKVWAERLHLASDILEALTIVNVAGTGAFSVVFPSVKLDVPHIASDLVVGVGYIAATLGVLSTRGMNPTGALATGAVLSAVLAISLQSTLGNILGGVALQLDGSIHEGDWIQLENGKQGRVRSVRWRHTVVETRDWSTIIVPNAHLLASNIIILGRRDGRDVPQRYWIWFNVDFRYNPQRVVDVVTDALRGAPIENVADDPPPNCVCMDFAKDMRDSMSSFAVRYWMKDVATDDPTQSRVRTRVYTALRRAGIPLAVPAHTQFVEVKDEERENKRIARQLKQRLEALKNVRLFQTLTEEELTTLAEGMNHVDYCAGELITRQGAKAHWLYVLTVGTAEIRAMIDPDGDGPRPAESRLVAAIQAPDFFGEMGLMTGEPRLADVVATSNVECFRLGRATFEHVLLARPEIATELAAKLAQRRVELVAARDGLDAAGRLSLAATERTRILGGIKSFFNL